ncbi:type IIL restriction-modification enzyme MmeI [Vreelandella lionensis]|uniref:Type IIL restriction-modification enzyme MmeI n=1 Tax=Vreelandella lionensis TaxID=1144478 RepID=A0ABW8BY56_9GAMM
MSSRTDFHAQGRAPFPLKQLSSLFKRCLSTMFSKDVELLPKDSITVFLTYMKETPEYPAEAIGSLWERMNSGSFSDVLSTKQLKPD